MSIHFSPGFKEVWSENIVRLKLLELSTAKRDTWIHANLSVSRSNWASRCLWSLVGKHFDCLRSLYFINPSQSAKVLGRLGIVLAKQPNAELYGLFLKAARNFTSITKHDVVFPAWAYGSAVSVDTPGWRLQEPIYAPAPPELVAVVEPSVEPVIVREVHEHHHVPAPPVVFVAPSPRPAHVVHHAPPRHATHHFSAKTPVGLAAGHEEPGAGRREAERSVASELARQNIHLASQPTVVSQRPVIPVAAVPPQAAKRVVPMQTRAEPAKHVPVSARTAPLSAAPVRHQPVSAARTPAFGHAGRVPVGGRK